MELEKNFIEYNIITLNIIKTVKERKYENLEEYFQQRQLILDNINKCDHSKEELKKFYFKYEIEKLDEILASDMKAKRKDLLKKIEKNKKRQIAVRGYNNISAKAVFLSKEV